MEENQEVFSRVGGFKGDDVSWEGPPLGYQEHVKGITCGDESACSG